MEIAACISTKAWQVARPDAIARSRDTATNPKVLDAFCLGHHRHRRRAALSGPAAAG